MSEVLPGAQFFIHLSKHIFTCGGRVWIQILPGGSGRLMWFLMFIPTPHGDSWLYIGRTRSRSLYDQISKQKLSNQHYDQTNLFSMIFSCDHTTYFFPNQHTTDSLRPTQNHPTTFTQPHNHYNQTYDHTTNKLYEWNTGRTTNHTTVFQSIGFRNTSRRLTHDYYTTNKSSLL